MAKTNGPIRPGSANRLSVLQLLLDAGPMRQVEIARACELSTSTVSTIITEARARGLVILDEAPQSAAQADRRGSAVAFNTSLGYVIGIDIGQNATRVTLGDLDHAPIAVEAVRSILNTPSDEAALRIYDAAQRLIDTAGIDPDRIVGVGIGMPSPQETTHRTIEGQQIFPGWTGERVGDELGRLFGKPAHVANDADAAALAESRWGAGRGARSLLHVLVHAGIGTGIVLNGEVYSGSTGRAGEIGHISIDPLGPLCYCGNRGCLQTYAGGDAVVSVLRPFLGADATLQDVILATSEGDRTAIRAVRDAGRFLGLVLGQTANVLNPDRITVSGMILATGDLFLEPMRAEFDLKAMHGISDIDILPSALSDDESTRASLSIVPIDIEQLREMQDA